MQPEDLLKYGMIPEFVGRLPVIAPLMPLSLDAMMSILTEPKNALIRQYQHLFALEDAKLKGKHIGIVAGTPPATNMAVAGLMTTATCAYPPVGCRSAMRRMTSPDGVTCTDPIAVGIDNRSPLAVSRRPGVSSR